MDVLPSYALASVARDVLLTWVIQKGRVQNMDLQQQKCIDSGVPNLSPCCPKYLGHPGFAKMWHGIPAGAFILQLDTSTDEAGARLPGSAASAGLFWVLHAGNC
jgi:hypothetical protein